jgi:hypothetical protein
MKATSAINPSGTPTPAPIANEMFLFELGAAADVSVDEGVMVRDEEGVWMLDADEEMLVVELGLGLGLALAPEMLE